MCHVDTDHRCHAFVIRHSIAGNVLHQIFSKNGTVSTLRDNQRCCVFKYVWSAMADFQRTSKGVSLLKKQT